MTTKWRDRITSIHVDLADFDAPALLQGLIEADWITEDEAAAIEERATAKDRTRPVLKTTLEEEFREAQYELRVGRKTDALIHLERFLGREWIGVLVP